MYEIEEWEEFKTLDGLCRKAGVQKEQIASLVAKELVDNALDVSASVSIEKVGNDGFYVWDFGPGIDPKDVPDLFSIRRPMKSTKRIRMPTRGALGNGLRVVASAVYVTGGRLIVSTKCQTLELIPQPDGTTKSVYLKEWNGRGTKIEVNLGKDAGPINLSEVQTAKAFSKGEYYKGKTSPWWYTSTELYELFQIAKGRTVGDLVDEFDGCHDKTWITDGFKGMQATDLSRDDAKLLLKRMRDESKPVNPGRLGNVGPFENSELCYSKVVAGTFQKTTGGETIEIPVVVEAWARVSESTTIDVYVNRTHIAEADDIYIYLEKAKLNIWGCGLNLCVKAKKHQPLAIWVNIITPHMPIASDSKKPMLNYMASGISDAIDKAVRKAIKNCPTAGCKRSQKDVVIDHLNEAMALASGNGKYRYSVRQLYYVIRPIVKEEINGELTYSNFNTILTDYESANGELPGIYRDNRGALYHPHLHDTIPLGTKTVEGYHRPEWTFNKILYCEKEGFFEILINDKWPERHDCALLTSKGYATRAARDLFDMLGDTEEEITFYCIHDADAYGTTIYESLQEETRARPGRKFKVINLGLEPLEAIEMGLEIENVDESERAKSVASYVTSECAYWLQTHRVELNAITTPDFIDWLDSKMAEYAAKLIPPNDVMTDELCKIARTELKDKIQKEILEEQNFDDKLEDAYNELEPHLAEMAQGLSWIVKEELGKEPSQSWRDPVRKIAAQAAEA